MNGVLRRVLSVDLVVLLACLVIVTGLAVLVHSNDTQSFDEWFLRSLRNPEPPYEPIGSPWGTELAQDFTALGSVGVLAVMTLAVLGYLVLARKYGAAMLVAVAIIGGEGVNALLKGLFHRPRPTVVPHLSVVHTTSFPSGHSLLSAVVYLTLGALLARLVQQRALKIYFVGVALLLTFLVGFSRMYLGVHYPTDVLAGWSAGLAWATLCSLVARYLQQRGAVEPPTD